MAKKLKNAMKAMEAVMSPESVERARIRADREVLALRLAQLREKCGVRQGEIENFSQTSVSRIEKRRDMKISTLQEYLSGLGMGLEIRAYPKTRQSKVKEEVLLRV
ncbi:MAG: XRE family transcriptional regulator [Spirochaetaceae bacterium]|jgi:hypothetical protein|nr:XRE family transcriptional regulator [Spirochaetaceae bacterium]